MVDQRATVVFGERDGVRPGHCLMSVGGQPVRTNGRITVNDVDVGVLQYLSVSEHYPLSMRFARPPLSSNEKIMMSSIFHAQHAIAAQLSPVAPPSGITQVDGDQFTIVCLQTLTGVKLIAVVDSSSTTSVNQLLAKVYELYADFALKNPFYALDMPIRCALFDTALALVLEKYNRSGAVTI